MEDTLADKGRILGMDRRSLPSPQTLLDGTQYELVVVLVLGAVGDYAAYMGMGSAEFVKRHGDKISFEMACGFFPGGQLERERYRL